MKVITFLAAILLGAAVQAGTTDTNKHLIASVEVREVADVQLSAGGPKAQGNGIGVANCEMPAVNNADPNDPLDQIDIIIDKIINIGKKVWKVVEAGRPVVNLKYDVATALPQGARCWLDLQTWKHPESKAYTMSYKNAYGAEMARVGYRVLYLHNGFVDGRGRYVGYAAVQPSDIRVSWGYNLDVAAKAAAIYNTGTRTEPIGGLQLEITWTLKTAFQHFTKSQVYAVDGVGNYKALE